MNGFPATVTVRLSSGYTYTSAATDAEARDIIKRLSALATADAIAHPEREEAAGDDR